MRTIKQIILGIILICLVLVAVANRETVVLNLVPEPLMPLLPFEGTLSLPLFVVIIASIAVGLVLGYLFEWLRERKIRKQVGQKTRQVSKLESEVERLKRKTGEDEDEILALLN